MKIERYLPLLAIGSVLTSSACATNYDDRPIPGTLESTDAKNPANENNTPRTNPTSNPEPAFNHPGPASDYRPVPVNQSPGSFNRKRRFRLRWKAPG